MTRCAASPVLQGREDSNLRGKPARARARAAGNSRRSPAAITAATAGDGVEQRP